MAKKILKFGGTSVGSIERINHLAQIIKKEIEQGNQIIAVVSAMSGKTNELVKMSKDIGKDFNKRELDVLLSSEEQVTCALLSGALIQLGLKARSWLNWQIPILTEGDHSNARIINLNTSGINDYLKDGIAIVPGFQGVSKNGDIERSPLINLRGLPLDDHELNEIKYEIEDRIFDICKSYSLNNKKQEVNLIDNLRNSLRKIIQNRLSKRPFTNINIIRL